MRLSPRILGALPELYGGLLLVALALGTSGCVMNERTQSDMEWKKYNPQWESPLGPDPRPQWGFFSVPGDF